MSQREAATDLARFLSSTPQYQELKQAGDAIKRNPTLHKTLRDFKMLVSAGQNSPEQVERIGREYQRLMQQAEFNRYFRVSDKYSEVLAGILSEVNAMLEKSLGLFE